MLRLKQLVIVQILMVFFAISAFPQAGTLDTTFNADGKVLIDFDEAAGTASSIIALDDTTTILCGSTNKDGIPAGYVMRVLQNGDQDMDFGTDGFLDLSFGIETYPKELALLPDGKILILGFTYLSYTNSDIFIARISQDGTFDASFGSNGYILYDYNGKNDEGYSMAFQSDGKIVLGGRTFDGSSDLLFMRIYDDGSIDTGFGTNGFTIINSSPQDEKVRGLGIMSNGSIIGAGDGYIGSPWYGAKAFVSKLDGNGNPVTSFAPDGVLYPAVLNTYSEAWGIKILNDSILVTGFKRETGQSGRDLFLTKFDSDGAVATDFGIGGIVSVDLNVWDIGFGIVLQESDKIYVYGTSGYGGASDSEFLLLRFLPDGSFDQTFDNDGYVLTNFRADWDEAYSMAIQPDGKLLLTGNSGGLTTSGYNQLPIARYLNDYTPFGAAFTVSPNPSCAGGTVNFTDLSTGNITGWNWTFEGGTPSTSTDQNPSVTYSNVGEFDVQLEITSTEGTTSSLFVDYIIVMETPGQATAPDGDTTLCSGGTYEYATTEIEYAQDYEWELNPADAGDLTFDGLNASLDIDDNWSGDFTLKVRATNICGFGDWSDVFEGTVNLTPSEFNLQGGGVACEGTDGVEITLDGSESAIIYELFLDDTPTGITVEGTGLPVSFGFIDVEGYYTAQAVNGDCIAYMTDQVSVEILALPAQAATPEGPVAICLEPTSDYTSTGSENADSYEWILYPEEAGTISFDVLDATVTWNSDYSGTALISLYGINDCGSGESSELEVSVGAANPIISGEEMVCDFSTEIYEVENNDGSTFSWTVTGGEITEGQGTYMATIAWNGEGNGTISVEEETADGCTGSSEMFEVLIDDCTGIVDNISNKEVNLYPNPAKNMLNISFNSHIKSGIITIYDITGKLILTNEFQDKNSSQSINISAFEKGVYMIKVQSEGETLSTKMFIKN